MEWNEKGREGHKLCRLLSLNRSAKDSKTNKTKIAKERNGIETHHKKLLKKLYQKLVRNEQE